MHAAFAAPSSVVASTKRRRAASSGIRRHALSWAVTPLLLVALLGQGCSGSSTAPGEVIEFRFDSDMDGWSKGTTNNGWGTVDWVSHSGKIVKFDGVGGPGQPNAWMYREIAVPAGARTLSFRASAHNRAGANTDMRVRAESGAASSTLIDWKKLSGVEGSMTFQDQSVNIAALAGQTVTLFFEQRDNGPGQHEQLYIDDIVIR